MLDIISKTLLDLDTKYGMYFENGLINSLAYCCFSIIIAFVMYKVIRHFIRKKDPDNRKVIVMIWKVFIIAILIYTCMNQFKPIQSLTKTLLASGGVLALVLSLAAQESIGNLIAGIVIILFKPFAVGDLIKVNGQQFIGYVEEITLRHTIIKSYEHNRITIPNSILNKSTIENANLIDTKKANFLEIQVSYDSDIKKAMDIIKEEATKHPLCLDVRSSKEKDEGKDIVPVKIISFADSGIVLRATVFSEDSISGFDMLSDLRLSILEKFNQENIEIPYPSRTLIIKEKDSWY